MGVRLVPHRGVAATKKFKHQGAKGTKGHQAGGDDEPQITQISQIRRRRKLSTKSLKTPKRKIGVDFFGGEDVVKKTR